MANNKEDIKVNEKPRFFQVEAAEMEDIAGEGNSPILLPATNHVIVKTNQKLGNNKTKKTRN